MESHHLSCKTPQRPRKKLGAAMAHGIEEFPF